MPRKIVWPKIKKIWWCYACNIPVLQNPCPRCGGIVKRLLLSDPGDARPAFERDYRFLYSAYVYEFKTSKGFNDTIGRSILLLNKAPYYDEMKEAISDGIQIGRLFFDPLLRRWRFRLSRYTAIKLYTSYPDILELVKVDKKRYAHSDIIRIDRDIEQGKQVVLLSINNDVVGIGYSRGKGKIMVHSWWGDSRGVEAQYLDSVYRRTDLNDVINAHRSHINTLAAQAKKFIAVTHEKIHKPIIASFSGGKDSLVSLHLLLSLGLDPLVLFNNTGIELPETIETVYRTVNRYGLKLVEASAEDRFWHAVYELGIPGRDYRWCCKVCKLAPLSRVVKDMWKDGGLNIVGQRAFESIDRARSPSLWRLRWAPMLLNLSPINEWSQFEVWLYIFINNLEANPLYFMGYERIGCFMCPASTLAELDLVSQTHKDLWSRWSEVLEYWAKRLCLPREWIDYGLWRWAAPARYRTMLAKRLKVSEKIDDWSNIFRGMAEPGIVSIDRDNDNSIKLVLEKNIDIDCIENQITVLNPVSYVIDRERHYVKIKWDDAALIIEGRALKASVNRSIGIERLIDLVKILYRWELCTGCRSCETICSSNATTLKGIGGRPRPIVDKSRCIGCKFCVYNCPVAEVYVEHIIAPLIFNDVEAWRRETREHHAEVLEKIKSFIVKTSAVSTKQQPNDSEKHVVDVSMFFQIGLGEG